MSDCDLLTELARVVLGPISKLIICAGIAAGAGATPWFVRRLSPPDPEAELDFVTMFTVQERFDRITRVSEGCVIALGVILTWPFAYLLHMLITRVISASGNAVYDGRRFEWWLGSGLTLALATSLVVVASAVRKRLGLDADLFYRYESTKNMQNPRHAMRLYCVGLTVMALLFGWASWNNGIVIDESGMRVRLAWYHRHFEYADVSRIEWLDGVNDAGEARPAQSLRVSFHADKPLTLDVNGRDRTHSVLASVAAYIGDRAKVPVGQQ